jgi:hypothetical protein
METKKLSFEEMETLSGSGCPDWVGYLDGLACGASLFWPIGTALAGPTCLGLAIGCAIAG